MSTLTLQHFSTTVGRGRGLSLLVVEHVDVGNWYPELVSDPPMLLVKFLSFHFTHDICKHTAAKLPQPLFVGKAAHTFLRGWPLYSLRSYKSQGCQVFLSLWSVRSKCDVKTKAPVCVKADFNFYRNLRCCPDSRPTYPAGLALPDLPPDTLLTDMRLS